MKNTHHYLAGLSLKSIHADVKEVEGFNAKVALLVTRLVGTMACAYIFCLIALAGLPTALKPGGEGIIAWIAQTFIQLVLLSVIMVGQNVQAAASDARSVETEANTEKIVDALNVDTEGGLKKVLDAIDEIKANR